MHEEERNAMIPRPSDAIEKIGSGPRGILSRMVSDALALAQSQEKGLTTARFRIGNYELRDPDYRQILLWAKAFELEPVVVIERLESSFCEDRDRRKLTFRVENGSIVTLALAAHLNGPTSAHKNEPGECARYGERRQGFGFVGVYFMGL